jgi:hypothetical protein
MVQTNVKEQLFILSYPLANPSKAMIIKAKITRAFRKPLSSVSFPSPKTQDKMSARKVTYGSAMVNHLLALR